MRTAVQLDLMMAALWDLKKVELLDFLRAEHLVFQMVKKLE